MPKLLGLGAGEGPQAVPREVLARGAADGGRRDEEVGRELQVAVVLHQPDKPEVLRHAHPIKVREV